jgi:cytoskeleton protein RodZ
MVENFGSYIKHERELRGVPLEEISGATKIHIRFLKALEENSFDELPGEVFIKGYIRSYATIIGSDVEEMLNIYKESVEFKNKENTPPEKESLRSQTKTFLILGLLIIVFAGVLFGTTLLIKEDSDLEEKKVSLVQKEISTTISDPTVKSNDSEDLIVEETLDAREKVSTETRSTQLFVSEPDPLDQGLSKKKTLPLKESIELNTQTLSTSRSDLVPQKNENMENLLSLKIRAKENSWFKMTIDDFREEDFILPIGSTKTFWANTEFLLTVGNKTGVELLLNGTTLILPKSKNRVVKDFVINSKLIE